jgi:pimeloyl-ACP methyl ester carboxylesterase
VITFDRPGWGGSVSPDDYRKTSIAEQSIATAAVLREQQVSSARLLGVGFGAVVGLELALAEPDLVESAVLLEPPLFDTLTRATEGMSVDVAAIREAAEEGGEAAIWRLFRSGGLPTLGAGAERLAGDPDESGESGHPDEEGEWGKTGGSEWPGSAGADEGPAAAHALLVELPAVPAWPLDPVRVSRSEVPVTVATMPSSPTLLVDAADALVPRIPGARRVIAAEDGPAGIAALVGDP